MPVDLIECREGRLELTNLIGFDVDGMSVHAYRYARRREAEGQCPDQSLDADGFAVRGQVLTLGVSVVDDWCRSALAVHGDHAKWKDLWCQLLPSMRDEHLTMQYPAHLTAVRPWAQSNECRPHRCVWDSSGKSRS